MDDTKLAESYEDEIGLRISILKLSELSKKPPSTHLLRSLLIFNAHECIVHKISQRTCGGGPRRRRSPFATNARKDLVPEVDLYGSICLLPCNAGGPRLHSTIVPARIIGPQSPKLLKSNNEKDEAIIKSTITKEEEKLNNHLNLFSFMSKRQRISTKPKEPNESMGIVQVILHASTLWYRRFRSSPS